MSLGHDPQNVFDVEFTGWCARCRGRVLVEEGQSCTCCSAAWGACPNCESQVSAQRYDLDYSPVEGRLADAREVSASRNRRQREAIRSVGAL